MPGTYVLVLKSHSEDSVRIGRWGIMGVEPGYYIYVGSALGPGGIRSRVTRHWRSDKAKHWHIDYLREILVPWEAWFAYGEERLEHQWANLLLHMGGMKCVPGFGCSDCRCDSHLFQTAVDNVSERDLERYAALMMRVGNARRIRVPENRWSFKLWNADQRA